MSIAGLLRLTNLQTNWELISEQDKVCANYDILVKMLALLGITLLVTINIQFLMNYIPLHNDVAQTIFPSY